MILKWCFAVSHQCSGVANSCFFGEPVDPKIVHVCMKYIIFQQIIVKKPVAFTTWLIVKIESKIDEVVVRKGNRYDFCFSDVWRDWMRCKICQFVCVCMCCREDFFLSM